jgi:hypothetical protein
MMPWKDQLRLIGRGLRWMYWPANQKAWSNVARWILSVTMAVAITYQLWLPLLAAFFLSVPVLWLGRKEDRY